MSSKQPATNLPSLPTDRMIPQRPDRRNPDSPNGIPSGQEEARNGC
jgi:hypothetical protein